MGRTRLIVEGGERLARNSPCLVGLAHHLADALGVGRRLDQQVLLLLLLPRHSIPVLLLPRPSIAPVVRHLTTAGFRQGASVAARLLSTDATSASNAPFSWDDECVSLNGPKLTLKKYFHKSTWKVTFNSLKQFVTFKKPESRFSGRGPKPFEPFL